MQLINRNFTRLFIGQAVSSVGNYVFDTTLVLWISTKLLAGKSYAPAAVSGLMVAIALSIIVFAPFAGVYVDRWDKRRTMYLSDLLRAGLVGVLVVVALLPAGTVPIGVTLAFIYAVVLLATGIGNFFAPAAFAFVGQVVGDDEARAKAASFQQSAGYGAAIIGPPLAAPLLFTAGSEWALIINALSFLFSYAMVRSIRLDASADNGTGTGTDTVPTSTAAANADGTIVPGEANAVLAGAEMVETLQAPVAVTPAPITEEHHFLKEFRTGLSFVVESRVMRVMIAVVTVATLSTGALNTLNVFFVIANLHADPHLYGTLSMGDGIGAIIGALTAGWIAKKLGDVRVLYLALFAVGIGTIVYARLGNFVLAIVVTLMIAVPVGALNVAIVPIVLRTVPQEIMGRAVSVVGPIQQLANIVSVVAAGWLVSTVMRGFHASISGLSIGPIDTIFTVCGLIMIVSGAYAYFGLRNVGPTTTEQAAVPEQAAAVAGEAVPAAEM